MFKTMIKLAIGLTTIAIVSESISEAVKESQEVEAENKTEKVKIVAKSTARNIKTAIYDDANRARDCVVKAFVYSKAYIGARLALRKREKASC